jgi:transcriptional regulator with XRE-family HTH domain
MEETARRAGVHRTYIGLLERAERQPTIVAAASVSEALNLSLGDLIVEAEDASTATRSTRPPRDAARLSARTASRSCVEADAELDAATGLSAESICAAVGDTYRTLDLLDGQLAEAGLAPFAELVELANLSAMIGNLLGAAIARHSDGSYERSGPHKYQDLRSTSGGEHIEIKTALERNRPKGHLAKPGLYLTFRYVLAPRDGSFERGERGDTAYVWEVRFGRLAKKDFDESNTPGDSGKTAVVKTDVLRQMERVYFDQEFFPYARLDGPWGQPPRR